KVLAAGDSGRCSMNAFAIATPKSVDQAKSLLSDGRYQLPVLKAGGMDVVDHLKEGLIAPDLLINIKRLGRDRYESHIGWVDEDAKKSLRVLASVTMTEMIDHDLVRENAPVIVQALERAATPQVRNVATAAGNLLQRPRCWYYRNQQFNCLKKGGDACYAVAGENKYHAVFGDGPCHIVHPSNFAPALMVCDGIVHLNGGKRDTLPIASLYHMPNEGVRTENTLQSGEIITHISFTPKPTSGFFAVKEKQSFDWPLAMCAVSLEMNGDTIQSAMIVAGAVAPIPWSLPHVAEKLAGKSINDGAALRAACELSVRDARPMTDNAYKLKLLPVVVRRAILRAAGKLPAELMEA
ncbi:MAG TPA: FAD binding domain-containing protein, partial [Phycisphaerales bacterium]|nr:FAD binding domain-containing protein [Phycisphaerales bacterium]